MKILITQDTYARSMDGPQHLAANTVVDVDPDAARAIASGGRALFVDAKDDPTSRNKQPGAFTAPADLVKEVLAAAKAAAKAAAAEAKGEA